MTFERGCGRFALGAFGALALLLIASPSRADTAISACGTLSSPGNYFLTKNLTSAGTCLTVASEGVSIDLKGHSITGNGTGDGISDGGIQFESMAIANGTITNFNVAIGLDKSCCVVIRNINASNNTATGVLVGGCCGALDSVTANNNGTLGIMAAGCCYSIDNVQANNNGSGGGIVATDCCTTIAHSTVTGNHGVGVFANSCCNSLVASKVQKNLGDGVDMSSCCNFVVRSTVASNSGTGVHLIGSDNLVTSTKVSKNGGAGIFLRTEGNQITHSQTTGNGGAGADVGCPGAITGLTAKKNAGGSLTTSGGTCTQLNNKL